MDHINEPGTRFFIEKGYIRGPPDGYHNRERFGFAAQDLQRALDNDDHEKADRCLDKMAHEAGLCKLFPVTYETDRETFLSHIRNGGRGRLDYQQQRCNVM